MQASGGCQPGRVQVEAPDWARRLVAKVCSEYDLKPPKLEWWKSASRDAIEAGDEIYMPVVGSYVTDPKPKLKIVEEKGDRIATKIYLLHEVAHHIAIKTEGLEGHEEGFWRICWGLYLNPQYRIPLEQAIYSEFAYLAKSEKVLREMGIELSRAARVAAELGAATRRRTWLGVQIRRLKIRLEKARRGSEVQSIKRQVRALKVKHKVENQVVLRRMPAYKRSVTKRVYKRSVTSRK
jgi:hypothetical protein